MSDAASPIPAPAIRFDAPGNGIGFVVLDRPEALNALSREMLLALHRQLDAWRDDPAVHAVVACSSRPRAFCAGGDIKRLHALHTEKRGADILAFFCDEYDCDHAIYAYPKPYIALMDGIVMGGGMGISQGASLTGGLRVVTPASRLAMPETRIGLVPDVGVSWILARTPGRLGEYLAVTGLSVEGADACYAGLADSLCSEQTMADLPARLRARSFRDGTEVVDFVRESAETDAQMPQASTLAAAQADINRHFSAPSLAEIARSLAADGSEWARSVVQTLGERSPLSMALALRHLRHAREQSIAECLREDMILVARVFEHGDIVEGIRALLIDKDGRPVWKYADIDALADVDLDSYFLSPWPHHPLAHLGV